MSRTALEIVPDNDFSLLSEYYVAKNITELSEHQQKILQRWQSANRILMKFPRKSVAARKLQALYPDISIRQAQIDIDNATKFWNIHDKKDKDWLYRFMVEHLTESVVSSSTPDQVKAKNFATLVKLYASIESDPIDPKFMEKSTVNIQFNLNHNNVYFTEQELHSIPAALRQKLLSIIQPTITAKEAEEIINS